MAGRDKWIADTLATLREGKQVFQPFAEQVTKQLGAKMASVRDVRKAAANRRVTAPKPRVLRVNQAADRVATSADKSLRDDWASGLLAMVYKLAADLTPHGRRELIQTLSVAVKHLEKTIARLTREKQATGAGYPAPRYVLKRATRGHV